MGRMVTDALELKWGQNFDSGGSIISEEMYCVFCKYIYDWRLYGDECVFFYLYSRTKTSYIIL